MNAIKLHYEVDGTDFTRAGEASASVKKTLRQLGVRPDVIRKVAIALYEGEINMVIHADGGYIDVDIDSEKVSLALCDHGKGIENIELAMQEGENVIKVLEDLEDEKFENLDFIELNACNAGCIGGVMTVENPYIARTKLKRLRKYLPVSLNHAEKIDAELNWDAPLEYTPVLKLDEDFYVAMAKMTEMEQIERSLPGLDCGSCGSPTCRVLAEDVVRGLALPDECIFKFRENISALVDGIHRLDGYIPHSLRGEKEDKHDPH